MDSVVTAVNLRTLRSHSPHQRLNPLTWTTVTPNQMATVLDTQQLQLGPTSTTARQDCMGAATVTDICPARWVASASAPPTGIYICNVTSNRLRAQRWKKGSGHKQEWNLLLNVHSKPKGHIVVSFAISSEKMCLAQNKKWHFLQTQSQIPCSTVDGCLF